MRQFVSRNSYSNIWRFIQALTLFIVLSFFGCDSSKDEIRKTIRAIKSRPIGENYFLYDKEFAASFLLTDDTATLAEEGQEIHTRRFLEDIAPSISRKKLTTNKDFYLVPFVTFPYLEKYHTDDPLRGTQITIQAELYDAYGTPVKEWDPTPMFDSDVDIDYQMLRKGKAFPINLDQSYAYGMYEARLVITDKLNNKMIEFKFPFELVHSLNG